MNNKGITLIEIIISIVLISIVLIFLFSLLVTVNDINYESEVNSTYLINKSLILKNIEEDFSKAEGIVVENCRTIKELYNGYPTDSTEPNYATYFLNNGVIYNKFKANRCLKFTYDWEDDSSTEPAEGYLGIYYYKTKSDYVISYIRGNTKATRTLPEFEKNNVKDNGNFKKTWDIKFDDSYKFKLINIPIIGSDGKDYSLNISYYQN